MQQLSRFANIISSSMNMEWNYANNLINRIEVGAEGTGGDHLSLTHTALHINRGAKRKSNATPSPHSSTRTQTQRTNLAQTKTNHKHNVNTSRLAHAYTITRQSSHNKWHLYCIPRSVCCLCYTSPSLSLSIWQCVCVCVGDVGPTISSLLSSLLYC